jgi:iron complex transport system permease protein
MVEDGGPGRPAPAADRRRRTQVAAAAGLVATLGAIVALSTAIGPEVIPWSASYQIVLHQLTGGWLFANPCPGLPSAQCSIWKEIVWDARLPDLVLAVTVGAALGMSGAGLQGVFRNPLADPYLLGLSAGAALGASSVYTFDLYPAHQGFALPLFAFVGGIIPGSVIYLAARRGRTSPQTLLLTGVALNAFFSAILATFLLYNPVANISVSFWLLGDLEYATWTHDGLVLPVVLVVGVLLVLRGRDLNLLQLGPDVAQSLGSDPRRVTREVVLLTTIVTAAAVAFTGIIGFIGLVAPHIVRRFVGVDYRVVIATAALSGAILLVVAWDVAQSVIPLVVIPVGIPTSFFGALFFLYLLYRPTGRGGRIGATT